MKSLLIVLLGTCFSFSSFSNFTTDAITADTAPMGSIVMEDAIMMVVDTEVVGVTVTTVFVYDSNETLVLEYNACSTSVCKINLSALDPGDYDVDVKTSSTPYDFSGQVTLT